VVVAAIACVTLEISGWAVEGAHYARDVRDIDAVQVAAGRFIAGALPAAGVVWSQDAGAIRYWGRRRTLDLNRLNTPELFDGTAISATWAPDAIIVAPALYEVTGTTGLMSPVAVMRSVSDPSDGLGVQMVLRCRANIRPEDANKVFVRHHGQMVAVGTCGLQG
jgi:hypothetical protein